MSVYKRPNGKWAAQVYDSVMGRPRQIGTFATRREAVRAESVAMDRRMATGRETVGSFAARWPADYPRPRLSTNLHNAGRVKAFATAYERRRMDSITPEEARAWALRHRDQLPVLRAMFNDARRGGMVGSNPFAALGIERSRGRRDLPSEWLTAGDVERLAQCAREVHAEKGYGETIAGLLVFAAYTGLRPGELFALQCADLGCETLEVRRAADSHTRTVTLPKNGRGRTVVYPDKAREAVESVPRLSGVELVFPAPRGGQLWSSTFSWVWGPVRSVFGRPAMALYEPASLLCDLPAGAGLGAGRCCRAAWPHRWRGAGDEHVWSSVGSRGAGPDQGGDGRGRERRAASVPRPFGDVDALRVNASGRGAVQPGYSGAPKWPANSRVWSSSGHFIDRGALLSVEAQHAVGLWRGAQWSASNSRVRGPSSLTCQVANMLRGEVDPAGRGVIHALKSWMSWRREVEQPTVGEFVAIRVASQVAHQDRCQIW